MSKRGRSNNRSTKRNNDNYVKRDRRHDCNNNKAMIATTTKHQPQQDRDARDKDKSRRSQRRQDCDARDKDKIATLATRKKS